MGGSLIIFQLPIAGRGELINEDVRGRKQSLADILGRVSSKKRQHPLYTKSSRREVHVTNYSRSQKTRYKLS